MSENGDEKQQGRRRGNSNEKELASQQIQIQSKRFYIDVKENQRGRFIKLAEVGVGGRKSRILMSMNAAQEFKNRLAEFSDLHSQLGPSHGGASDSANNGAAADNNKGDKDNDGLIKSETFIKDRKRYYLDLKENQRGRFLRVSMVGPGPRGPRTQVAIPAQGLIEFKDHLNDMLERYDNSSTDDQQQQSNGNQSSSGSNNHQLGGDNNQSSDGKSLRADNKTFYFDHGSNQRGSFLKISEVRQNRYRTSITIPEKYLKQFRDSLNEFVEKAEKNSSDSSSQSGEQSSNKQTVASVVAAAGVSSDKKSDEKK